MSDPNDSPVTLAAGAYDYDDLKDGLEKAAKGSAKNYETARDKAVDEANAAVFKEQDPRGIPGFRFEDVTREDLGIVERVQVFDPKLAEKQEVSDRDDRTALVNNQAAASAQGADKASKGE